MQKKKTTTKKDFLTGKNTLMNSGRARTWTGVMNMDWFFCQAKVVSLSISFRRGYKTEINIFFAAERSLNKPLLPLLPLTPQSNSGLRLLLSAFSYFIFNLSLQSCLSVSIGPCKISPGHVEIATRWYWRIERNRTVQYFKIPFHWQASLFRLIE